MPASRSSDPGPVIPQIVWDVDEQGFRATCFKCGYEGPLVSDQLLANAILKRHTSSRDHRTNIASPTRFKL